jgi:hypothetical protein
LDYPGERERTRDEFEPKIAALEKQIKELEHKLSLNIQSRQHSERACHCKQTEHLASSSKR